jgi:hypothetical protein
MLRRGGRIQNSAAPSRWVRLRVSESSASSRIPVSGIAAARSLQMWVSRETALSPHSSSRLPATSSAQSCLRPRGVGSACGRPFSETGYFWILEDRLDGRIPPLAIYTYGLTAAAR